MARDLDRADDVQESLDSMETQGNILRIPEGRTPVYILNSEYADGYAHWVKAKGGGVSPRVVCAGGVEGKGWVPEECPICALVAALYKKAKSIEAKHGETDEVKTLRKSASNIRAKYEAHFLAVKGELVKERVKGGKKMVPDFEDGQVGILSLTRQQFEDFVYLRKSDKLPFMKDGEDLTNRIIVLDKRKRGKSTYATTEFIPSKRTSDPPDLEYDEEEFDLEEDFEVDEDDLENAADLSRKSKDDDDDDFEDDDVDFEDDDDDDDDAAIDDDFLDDDDDDLEEAEEEKETKKKKSSGKKKKSTSKKKKKR